jgi:hypothetical protein
VRNIRKLLNKITEKYWASPSWKNIHGEKYSVDVYKNSDASEILKLLKNSTKFGATKALRFFMNDAGDYILWSAGESTHDTAIRGDSLRRDFRQEDLRGQIFEDRVYIYVDSAEVSYPDDKDDMLKEERFKESRLYKTLSKAGITDVEFGEWL